MERESLSSRLGFILLSAGCAIGIGNVWKFPYIVGENGGAIFVLIYIFFLLVLGIPVMTMEFSLGRAAKKSPVLLYQQIEPKGSKWHFHGYISMLGNYILMMFYTTVAGWMLRYFFSMVSGDFVGLNPEGVGNYFGNMLGDPLVMTLFMGIVVAFGFFVCSKGLKDGIEKVTKVMMISLLVIMIALAINSFFLDGGLAGLEFYLMPNVERVKEVGILNVIVAAMNQAFFTLSIGMGSMAIFGSYINKDHRLLGESINVAVLDTFVAFTSGLIIFPACFAYGVSVTSGPKLIFVTLPNIFNNLPLGRLWGSLFFLFMTFAAVSTVLAVFECIIACTTDLFKISRKKACLYNCIIVFALSLPCVLGFNVLSGVSPLGAGTNILDFEDFLVSNLILPLGSLIYVVFIMSRYGWGFDNFLAEANTGKGPKVQRWMRPYFKYVLPVIILGVFLIGIL